MTSKHAEIVSDQPNKESHSVADLILLDPGSTGLSNSVRRFIQAYFKAHHDITPAPGLYERILQEAERPLLEETLIFMNGNQKKAAFILGINRNTLRKKLIALKISPKDCLIEK